MPHFESIVAGLVVVFILILQAIFRRLAALEQRLNHLYQSLGAEPGPAPLSDRVKLLAADPMRKIEAIKAYRDETGVGLKDAKDAVEAYLRGEMNG